MCIYIHPGEDVRMKRKIVEKFISEQQKGLVESGVMRPRRNRRPSEKKVALDKENVKKQSNKKLPKCGVCEAIVDQNHQQITCVQCETVLHLICSGLDQEIKGYYCMDCMGNELELSRTLEQSIQTSGDSDDAATNVEDDSLIQIFVPKTAEITQCRNSNTEKNEINSVVHSMGLQLREENENVQD